MDAVVTYVDNSDKLWYKDFLKYKKNDIDEKATNEYRFCAWDNLKYCLRSIAKNLPFIRKVHLIVSGPSQVPDWVNQEEVNVVYHKDIIPEEYLPTFNSRTIEMCMHNIKDLDEEFIYFNDDMFIFNPCKPEDIFLNGKPSNILIEYSKEKLLQTWGRSPIYGDVHIRCNETPKRLLNIKDKTYYLTNHGPSPMLKSDNIELFELLKEEILPTLTRFRDENNYVHFMYSIYTFLKGNTSNVTFKNTYISSNSFDLEKLYKIIYDDSKSICVNDINYREETKEYIKVFMSTKKQILEMKFTDICKYEKKPKVSLCVIIKNENKYLREFVEHYLNLGFSNIYLYDNNDYEGEHPNEVIEDYINNGFVIYHNYRNWKVCQKMAYNDCYEKYSKNCDWIAFFDCDEFLQLTRHGNISSFISQDIYDKYNCVFINWLCYGDSEHLYYEDKPIVERFYQPAHNEAYFGSIPINYYVKSIVRTNVKKLNFKENVHYPSGNNVLICNTIGQPCLGATFHFPIYGSAILRHYITKSLEEFMEKTKRGYPDHIVDKERKEIYLKRFFKINKVTPEKIELMNKLKSEL